MNILVCDDDKEIVGAIEIYLNNEGYQVYKAYDGLEALNVVEKEEKSSLRRAIADLKEPYREVVILHIYGERSLKEIAASFGKSESWARVTFYRAKQILSEEIKEGEKK